MRIVLCNNLWNCLSFERSVVNDPEMLSLFSVSRAVQENHTYSRRGYFRKVMTVSDVFLCIQIFALSDFFKRLKHWRSDIFTTQSFGFHVNFSHSFIKKPEIDRIFYFSLNQSEPVRNKKFWIKSKKKNSIILNGR